MLTTRLVRRALKNPVEDTVKTDLSGDVPLVGLICVHLVDFLMRLISLVMRYGEAQRHQFDVR